MQEKETCMFCYSSTRVISPVNYTSWVSCKQSLLKALELIEQNMCFEERYWKTEEILKCNEGLSDVYFIFFFDSLQAKYE